MWYDTIDWWSAIRYHGATAQRTNKNLLYPALLGKRDDLFVSFCFLCIMIYILQMLAKVSIINIAVFTNPFDNFY